MTHSVLVTDGGLSLSFSPAGAFVLNLRTVGIPCKSANKTPAMPSVRRPLLSRPLDLVYFCFFRLWANTSCLLATCKFSKLTIGCTVLDSRTSRRHSSSTDKPCIRLRLSLKHSKMRTLGTWHGRGTRWLGNVAGAESGFLGAWFRSFVILELWVSSLFSDKWIQNHGALQRFPTANFFRGFCVVCGEVGSSHFFDLVSIFTVPFSTDSRSIYPLLLIYGASTATTTLACIATFLASPTSTGPSASEALTLANFSIPAPTAEQIRTLLGLYLPYLLVPLLMTIDMAQRIGKLMGRAASKEGKGN